MKAYKLILIILIASFTGSIKSQNMVVVNTTTVTGAASLADAVNKSGIDSLKITSVHYTAGALTGTDKMHGDWLTLKKTLRNLEELVTDEGVTVTMGEGGFGGNSSIKIIEFDGLTAIDSSAFAGCTALTTVSLPKAATAGPVAFLNCSQLKIVDLPIVGKMDSAVFAGCTLLTDVWLPKLSEVNRSFARSSVESVRLNSMTTIDANVFSGCTKLVRAYLPKAVKFTNNAFFDCENMQYLFLGATVPTEVGSNAFANIPVTRYLSFIKPDTDPLLNGDYMAAAHAYKYDNDGSTADNKWHKWNIMYYDISKVLIYGISDSYVLGSEPIRPAFYITLAGNKLIAGTDYDVAYGANNTYGTGTITLTGKGDYIGTKVISFSIEPQKYSIQMPSVKNATTNPSAGEIRSEAGKSFEFTVTPDAGFSVKVTTDQGETLYPYNGNHYAISNLSCNTLINIEVLKATAVENVEKVALWSKDGSLYIASPQPSKAFVINILGQIVKVVTVPSGTSVINGLANGVYIVRIGTTTKKVVVR